MIFIICGKHSWLKFYTCLYFSYLLFRMYEHELKMFILLKECEHVLIIFIFLHFVTLLASYSLLSSWILPPFSLGHFFNFGSLDQLHIPYFDTCKWFLRFGYVVTRVLHLDHSITTFHWYRITCLNQFSAIFTCLVYQIDFVYLIEFLRSSNKVHLFKHIRTI